MKFTRFFAIGVLAAGLTSCTKENPDETQKDNFKAKPPVIVTDKGKSAIEELQSSLARGLDILDVIDTRSSGAKTTRVVANCSLADQKIQMVHEGAAETPVPLIQILPTWVLVQETIDLGCDLEFTLTNPIGSRHIFTLNNVRVTNSRAPNARLSSSSTGDSYSAEANDPSEMRVRFSNSGAAASNLICQDARFETLSFESVRELNDFDLSNPVLLEGKNGAALLERPIQTCRVFISQEGHYVAYSPIVRLKLPRPPIEFSVSALPSRIDADPVKEVRWPTELMGFARPMTYGEYRITNSLPITRKIKFSRAPLEFRLCLLANAPTVVTRPWFHVYPADPQNATVQQTDDSWVIEIAPGGTFLIRAELRPERGWDNFPNAKGVLVRGPGSLHITDLDADNREVGGFDFSFGSELIGGIKQPVSRAEFNESSCPSSGLNHGYYW